MALTEIKIKEFDLWLVVNRQNIKLPANLSDDLKIKNYIINNYGPGVYRLKFYKEGKKQFTKQVFIPERKKIKNTLGLEINENEEDNMDASLISTLTNIETKITVLKENTIDKIDSLIKDIKSGYEARINELIEIYEDKIKDLIEENENLQSNLDELEALNDKLSDQKPKSPINDVLTGLITALGMQNNASPASIGAPGELKSSQANIDLSKLGDLIKNNPQIQNILSGLVKKEAPEVPVNITE